MRPPGPKFWLLGDGLPWPTQSQLQLGVSPTGGISLAEDPTGPLGLESPDGSVGRLALPAGMAFDESLLLYIANRKTRRILRFNPATQRFAALPLLGGWGSARREFLSIGAIAIGGHRLSIADSIAERVVIVHAQTLAIVAEWTAANVTGGWVPKDLVQVGSALYILDDKHHRVLRSFPWSDELETVTTGKNPTEQWLRLIADESGLLYVLVKKNGAASLRAWDLTAHTKTDFAEPATVRNRFPAPAIEVDSKGRFRLPDSLAAACARHLPVTTPKPPVTPPRPPAVKRFDLPRAYYELDRDLREVRVYNEIGQLRSRFAPRDTNGTPVDAKDIAAWDPTDLRERGECVYILDSANQQVWRHRFGSDLIEPDPKHNPWQAPQFKPVTATASALWFDTSGQPAAPPDLLDFSNQRLYERSGHWLSNPIPSAIHRCQWDRIQLSLAAPPPGASIEVLTFSQDGAAVTLTQDDPRWDHAYTYVAPLESASTVTHVHVDFQIKSRPAENLSVQIRLFGDGYETTVIKAARVYYPRDSYVQFLPNVYSSQDEMRAFLEGFLGACQVTGDNLDLAIRTVEKNFDPDAVPPGPAMQYLAGWLALNLEGAWTAGQNRLLLSQVPKIYPFRGTPQAFRDFLRVYVANAAGMPIEDVQATEFPLILEGFAERRALMLNVAAGPLWGPSAVGRLQLGEYSTAGEVSLVSLGDPDLDAFDQYAHRFKIFIPAAWIRSADAETLIRRAVDAEKPAHTAYELVLIENRIQVGIQSTVGFDTVIGSPAGWHLPSASGPGNQLNISTILGGTSEGITVSAGELLLT